MESCSGESTVGRLTSEEIRKTDQRHRTMKEKDCHKM